MSEYPNCCRRRLAACARLAARNEFLSKIRVVGFMPVHIRPVRWAPGALERLLPERPGRAVVIAGFSAGSFSRRPSGAFAALLSCPYVRGPKPGGLDPAKSWKKTHISQAKASSAKCFLPSNAGTSIGVMLVSMPRTESSDTQIHDKPRKTRSEHVRAEHFPAEPRAKNAKNCELPKS